MKVIPQWNRHENIQSFVLFSVFRTRTPRWWGFVIFNVLFEFSRAPAAPEPHPCRPQ
jgi:hypothetical protein